MPFLKIQKRQFDNWILVLPPWGRIGYHWRERNLEQSKIPWSKFFDTEQLSRYVPTLELTDYFEEIGEEKVEEIWVECLHAIIKHFRRPQNGPKGCDRDRP